MKKKLLLAVLLCFAVLAVPCAQAETSDVDVALKVDYFHFSDSQIKNLNAGDGVYIGVESYKRLFCPNLYLGLTIGWAGTSGSVSGVVSGFGFEPAFLSANSSIDYVPIEFNLKYVIPISPCFNFAFGGGPSINYFSISSDAVTNAGSVHLSDSDWVWGGQFFAELNYNISNWVVGIDLKYQLTEDLHLFGVDTQAGADNFRAGGRVGFKF